MEQGSGPIGLRERKKREMRLRIREIAIALFATRGFDQVTVTEIATAADVSPATVFNYFPTKEDLIFHGMAEYGRQLVVLLASRPPEVSMLEAFRAHLLEPRGVLASDDPAGIAGMLQTRAIIAGSTALQEREHLINHATAVELAALIAGGPPQRVQPWFLATAMMGIIQALAQEIHRLAAAGHTGREIAAIVLPQGSDAVAILEAGLAAIEGAQSG